MLTFNNYKEKVIADPRSEKLNFDPDGRLHYVYRVSSLLEENHYYGSKTDTKIISIGLRYFTSSNNLEFRKDFKTNPEDYKVKIIRYFNNKADKIIYESYLHYYFNVKDNIKFLNRMNQTAFGCDNTGIKYTEESKKHMSVLSTRREAKINNNPTLSKARKKKQQLAFEEFRKDKVRYEKWRKQRSESSLKQQQEIREDPKRKEANSKAHSDAQNKLRVDPIRNAIRSKKIIKNKSKPIMQFDLDNNFIAVYASQKIAAESNLISINGISRCAKGKQPNYKNYFWVRVSSLKWYTDVSNIVFTLKRQTKNKDIKG